MTETEQAAKIAKAWLDGRMNSFTQMVPGDPDCDACVLARQYIRAIEQERERCAKIADGWLSDFGDKEPKYVSAQTWASDAVKDIAAAIRNVPA